MNFLNYVRDLFRHMEWADATLWQCILASEAAQSDPLIQRRMQHLHSAQRAFLAAWTGDPVSYDEHPMPPAELLPRGIEVHVLAAHYLERLKPGAMEEGMVVPWSARAAERLGRAPSATTLAETMLQVVLHSTHHRGQVATRLNELGATAPTTDYIVWLWSGRPAAVWPPLTVG